MASDRPPIAAIEAFVTVARLRRFSAAAGELGVSSSALSQQVRRLEERLGVRLLNRTTRGVGLTEAGERYLARCAPLLTALKEAASDVTATRTHVSGTLRITLPRIALTYFIGPGLPELLARYPELQLELVVDDALTDLIGSGLDAGIRIEEMVERDMIAVPLTPPIRLVTVAAPEYVARRGEPRVPEDLLLHDCINHRFRTSHRIYRWEFVQDGETVEIAVNGRLTLNDSEVAVDAALAGLGITCVFEQLARSHLASGRLVELLAPFALTFPGFCVYYPQRERVPAKLRAFIDFYRERLGQAR
ncbi:MAG TPA: LysR family transcriptional regulator [Burkholderiales bacterium]|nr:LysR family transcriptional regulator [Burkholderiales bacterium]